MWWNRLCDNVLPEKTMPFDLLTVLPTRLDVEVNGFNGGVLNGVPSAYHWYTEQYGVKWPVGYEVNISRQGENFIQVDFDTPVSAGKQRCCRIKPPFRLHAGALVRRTGLQFLWLAAI